MAEAGAMVLVIAFGNPLREDDGVGWAVGEALRGRRDIEARTVHQLVPELVEPISRAPLVVFVDARRDGTAGEVRRSNLMPATKGPGASHTLDPAALLALCQQHFGHAPEAVLISVTGLRFGFGDDLSPEVRRAVPQAVAQILGCRDRAAEVHG